MKTTVVFVALFATVWAYPQAKNKWEDFPMRHMFVDGKVLNDPSFHPESRILNGQEVTPHSIPYQVWLILRIGAGLGGWSCGGSLITTSFVLTAAHCLRGAGIAEVYIGAHDIADEEPQREILVATRLFLHPDYIQSTITNDIGLIDLEVDVKLSPTIGLAQLPRLRDLDELFEGDNVRLSGWGLTVGGGSRSNVLLAVNSTIISNDECRAAFNIFQESEICISGAGGVGACNGDSGGPLVSGNTQIGIVSYGRSGCPPGAPSVFVRITSFITWIVEVSGYAIQD